jgi:4,5:9,10-diseco-3-hydroxy-5,9,17-trioxoandrosta-1(10),2-diene-4-oate hydrolase
LFFEKEATMSLQTPQDQFIKVGQINTRFWALGDEGTTVVLVHGIGASVEDWIFNIHALAEHHRVYAIDLVGFGHSDKPPVEYTTSYEAQFVKDFMEAQNIDHANLIGHSMGGGIALQFVIQFPHKVQKLVLVASAGLGKELYLPFRLCTLPLLGERLTRPSQKGTAQLLNDAVYDPALVTDDWVELGYQLAVLPGAQGPILSALRSSCNLRGMRDDVVRDIADNLANITAPTLIIWGEQDGLIPVAHAQAAAQGIPNSRLHVFDRCGHIPQREHADEFNALVLEFLASEGKEEMPQTGHTAYYRKPKSKFRERESGSEKPQST